jgi:hypothetical protein
VTGCGPSTDTLVPWQELLFVRALEDDAALMTVSTDGSGLALVRSGVTTVSASPNGAQLVYEDEGGWWALAEGDEEPEPFDVVPLAWSPAGLRVAGWLRADAGLWVHDFADGIRVRVSDARAATPVSWAPDGSRLAAVVDALELWVMDADGATARRVASADEEITTIAWAPDGASIALLTYGSAVVVDVTSGARTFEYERGIPPGYFPPNGLGFSADGQWLAWFDLGGAEMRAPDGTVRHSVAVAANRGPHWAAETNHVAFLVPPRGGDCGGDCSGMVIVDAQTRSESFTPRVRQLAWAPTGLQVAVVFADSLPVPTPSRLGVFDARSGDFEALGDWARDDASSDRDVIWRGGPQ